MSSAQKIQRFCMTSELIPERVEEYLSHHQEVWPEVVAAFAKIKVIDLNLFLKDNLVIMLIDYAGEMPFEEAMRVYLDQPKIAEWEELMGQFKKPNPDSSDTGFVFLKEICRIQT